jgi:hypothetical protein
LYFLSFFSANFTEYHEQEEQPLEDSGLNQGLLLFKYKRRKKIKGGSENKLIFRKRFPEIDYNII